MRKLTLTLAALALSAGVLAVGKADAMPLGGIGKAADRLNPVEQTQYVWGGRNYCWYPGGWQGPGWYWCGYNMRRGFGWGGGAGWRGWHHGPRAHGHRGHGFHHRDAGQHRHGHPGNRGHGGGHHGGHRR